MEKIIQRELQGNATYRKRNESIVFKGFLLVGSVIDSITAKKSCGKVSHIYGVCVTRV